MTELERRLENIKQILKDLGVEANGLFYNYYVIPRVSTAEIEYWATLYIYEDGKIVDGVANYEDLKENWARYWDWDIDISHDTKN